MHFCCRTYKDDDFSFLQSLLAELGYPLDEQELAQNIKGIVDGGGEIFIAEKKGEVVGSVCVVIDARLAEGVYGEIVSLVVAASARAKGVGRALVKQAEEWAAKRVDRIRVRANVVRNGAHLFYEAQGFECVKTQKVFKKTAIGKNKGIR